MDRLLFGPTECPCAHRDRPRFCYLLPLLRWSSGAHRILRVPGEQTAFVPLGLVFGKDEVSQDIPFPADNCGEGI
jgi:hypothetical protein